MSSQSMVMLRRNLKHVARNPTSVFNAVLMPVVVMLMFFSSAIVPAAKMGPGVREFAQYQPFTPVIETLRGLLDGAPAAGDAIAAVAWCVGIALVGYLWARSTFTKRA